MFIEYLTYAAGNSLDFERIDSQKMIEASIDAFNGDYEKMEKIFAQIIEPLSEENKKDNVIKILMR